MVTTKIANVMILTMAQRPSVQKFYPAGEILVRDDLIEEIGERVSTGADRVLDGRGMLAMPGLINSHNHFEQSFMNGIVRLYPGSTSDWIRNFKIPITAEMTTEDYYLSAMLTCLNLIRSGVTSSVNHMCQQSPEKLAAYGVREQVRAIVESGIRSLVPIGLAAKNEPDEYLVDAGTYADLLRDWHREHNDAGNGRVRIWPGPAGFWSTTAPMWEVVRRFCSEHSCGIHTHLATFFQSDAAMGDIQQALEMGVLGPNFTGAHCVWLDASDIRQMAEHDVKVAHCPTYKLSYSLDSDVERFGDGIAPIAELVRAGCSVGLGQDGCMGDTQDLFKEMRNLAFTQHYRYRDKRLFPPSKLLEMVTIDAARTMLWDGEIGSLDPGKKADVILLDLDDSKFVPRIDLLASVVYQGGPADVDTVMVDGDILMEHRKVVAFDEAAVVQEAQRAAAALIDRAGFGELAGTSVDNWVSGYRMS